MCGICGKLFFERQRPVDRQLIRSMADSMRHRGPDDEGYYISGQIGLGHRRLSIIDLNRGKQPISNEDDTIWIVFNGEIYNYQALRESLSEKGHKFKTDTDTEVIVHAYEEFGENCVARLRGMFAFAIWDQRSKTLLVARDRVGIKPLYYFLNDDQIIFASEMKAILLDNSVPRNIDPQIIDRFLTYYYVPGEETMLRGIRKLSPGHYLIARDGKIQVRQYWDLDFSQVNGHRSLKQASQELLEILKESVRLHMISDVPVGILLSGGVDSTALLSLSVHETDKELSTFTIGFEGHDFADERPYARLAAKRFGTQHYDMTMSAQDFLAFLPRYVWHMEEPVCEPPAVALYYVSKLASEHVKVLISGEGGDEAFAGYPNYRNGVWLERLKAGLGPFRPPASRMVRVLSQASWLQKIRKFGPLMTVELQDYYLSRTATPFTLFNRDYSSLYTRAFLDQVNKKDSCLPTVRSFQEVSPNDVLSKMLYVDTMSWLPDDLLVKADKITMANSVELRVPLLDHEVLEFAASLPSSFKLHGITTKHILKTVFRNLVPQSILDRKKTGLPVPYETWMRKELKPFVEETLLSQNAHIERYFNRQGIEKILSANLNGENYSKEIFSLVVLELWHKEFVDSLPASCYPS